MVTVAPKVRDLSDLAKRLTGWLRTKLPDARDLELANLTYPSGAGMSHETILFDARWRTGSQRHTRGYVVRIKPVQHPMFPDDLFEQQYRLMRLLREQGNVRVAEVFWMEEDPSIVGAPFFVMEKLQGRVPVSVPPYAQVGWVAQATPAQRRKLWENGVRQLAAVQKTPLSSVQFLRGREGAAEGLAQEWDKYVRFVEWVSESRRWPILDEALQVLRSSWPDNQPPGLVWGDARIGNMMFDDNFEVVAVMDWEQPSLGGALHDLAWWLEISNVMHSWGSGRPHLEGMGTREETIELWNELTGISTADIEWYEGFTRLKTSVLSIRMATLRNTPLPTEVTIAQRLRLADIANRPRG
jgi:aminoglycoside phosphotransferase (APT) family kinase protein